MDSTKWNRKKKMNLKEGFDQDKNPWPLEEKVGGSLLHQKNFPIREQDDDDRMPSFINASKDRRGLPGVPRKARFDPIGPYFVFREPQ